MEGAFGISQAGDPMHFSNSKWDKPQEPSMQDGFKCFQASLRKIKLPPSSELFDCGITA